MDAAVVPLRDLALAELARLCESEALRRSPMHARLRRYLVEHALAHDRLALTETAIAIAVFRRDPRSYDANVDPIVRVSVGRLRTRLGAWYAQAAGPRALRILLPRGRYVPEFVLTGAGAGPRARIAVLDMRNASGRPRYDPFCRRFERALAEALVGAGERLVDRRPRSALSRRAALARDDDLAECVVDSVLTTDHDGALRITVRAIDAVDRHVRWVETVADAPCACATLGRRVTARVIARLAMPAGAEG